METEQECGRVGDERRPPAAGAAGAPDLTTAGASRATAMAGLAIAALGAAGLVMRYAFLPMGGGAATGLLIGMVVGGYRMWANNRPAGSSSPPVFALVAGIVTLALMSIGAVWVRPSLRARYVPLVTRTLPSLSVDLPDWFAEKLDKQPEAGSAKFADPDGGGRFLEVRWNVSNPTDSSMFVSIYRSLGASLVSSRPATVGGHPGETLFMAAQGGSKLSCITYWHCPEDRRVIQVACFLDMSIADLTLFHQRILSTVKCHTLGKAGRPKVNLPKFDPPAGFYAMAQSNPVISAFVRGDQEYVVFTVATPGKELEAALGPDGSRRITVMKAECSLATLEEKQPVQQVQGALGHSRSLWLGVGSDGTGGKVRIALVNWHCDRRDLSFLGYHVSDPGQSIDQAVRAMLNARCHGTGPDGAP
ncbi:MAG: hypothetical protein HY815_00135 [Candidatus Riflebacteria bacterium]|nr:hypothetical protein [Candidatus Riflebacteria bacterium]